MLIFRFSRSYFLLALLLFILPRALQAGDCADCKATLHKGVLSIENSVFKRVYEWNDGQIISRSIKDKRRDREWALSSEAPDFALPINGLNATDATLETDKVAATSIKPAHLRVQIDYQLETLQVRRLCRLYGGVAALQCEFYFKGRLPKRLEAWRENASESTLGARKMVEDPHAKQTDSAHAVIERLALPGRHWQLRSSEFEVATDYNDTLVDHSQLSLYRKDNRLQGNILSLRHSLTDDQFYILKESPSKADQLYYPGYDFLVSYDNIRVVGLGLDANDINPDTWVRSYGVVTGLAGSGRLSLLTALREYLETVRVHKPTRDNMVLMNTWGDRNRDGRVSEAFISEELRAAAALGITHFQIDDGWQAGLSSNSASASGKLWTNWLADSWVPHPERFPNGLGPVVRLAKNLNIELGIWFNPSSANDYANWLRDADILLGLYRDHGIRVFKIDGIDVQTKMAEINLRSFFDRVQSASDGEVVFNLDVTAGRRPGYFYMTEYGNIFLENRYTDWANYYPHRTLRNLWMLSSYVPAQRLQIEFLNKWRNAGKYADDDSLAPGRIPFDYQFAVTMFAQPLAWFEATGLPPEAVETSSNLNAYQTLQDDIHRGRIFPIGSLPTGRAWTGFQSIINDKQGYLLILRELNQAQEASVKTWLPANREVAFEHLLGHGKDFVAHSAGDGRVSFELGNPHSYGLYRYTIE